VLAAVPVIGGGVYVPDALDVIAARVLAAVPLTPSDPLAELTIAARVFAADPLFPGAVQMPDPLDATAPNVFAAVPVIAGGV
jgi:hypothetical protein